MKTSIMEKNEPETTYDITMESGNEVGARTDFLIRLYAAIDSKARQLAPAGIRNELLISQDGNVKTTFHVKVSGRMAPYLVNSIQQNTDPSYGIALKSYLNKLQEQIMSQMFAGVKDVISY
jgi:hypothetical protein